MVNEAVIWLNTVVLPIALLALIWALWAYIKALRWEREKAKKMESCDHVFKEYRICEKCDLRQVAKDVD